LRALGEKGFSEEFFVKNDQYSDRRPSTLIRYPPSAAGFPSLSQLRQSISAAAVDRLHKLDHSDESLNEKNPTGLEGAGDGRSDRSRSWVPGTAALDKLYDLIQHYDEKDGMSCLVDDASASSNERPGGGLGAQQFLGDFKFKKSAQRSSGDAVWEGV
jgi:hypothetical protein